ncbi:hypothetical protein ARMSODRAFT_789775 [Armillaria solidipes]|uniref:Uncharacterized protein n=1 Tax=Armillaria solidipes TaxID=1076256 RepID=A0A2H3C952_9AGAR|nr:hypothetical protein ARMSODRAFT_789775 [Armillaria solidipes]
MWLSVLPSFQQSLCRQHRRSGLLSTSFKPSKYSISGGTHLGTFNCPFPHFNMRREPARSDNEQSSRTFVWLWSMVINSTSNTNLSSCSSPVSHRTNSYTRNPLSKKRENDAREIESGIHELAEIYWDLRRCLIASRPSSVTLDTGVQGAHNSCTSNSCIRSGRLRGLGGAEKD